MKKIILNKCYGGFGVSDKVYEEYAKEKGFKLFRYEMINANKYVSVSYTHLTLPTILRV